MNTQQYPLFIPPEQLTAKPHREWSKRESQLYFDWLMSAASDRVSSLLRYLALGSDETSLDRGVLIAVGDGVSRLLVTDDFSHQEGDSPRTLTNHGYAMAADTGLLVAQLLQQARGSLIQWKILRSPKSDMSYNLPVLTGFGKLVLDPVGGSVAEATGLLSSYRGADAWVKMFDFWVEKAQ